MRPVLGLVDAGLARSSLALSDTCERQKVLPHVLARVRMSTLSSLATRKLSLGPSQTGWRSPPGEEEEEEEEEEEGSPNFASKVLVSTPASAARRREPTLRTQDAAFLGCSLSLCGQTTRSDPKPTWQ